MRPQAAKRITNHASQTPGHVHLAEYSPTSVTRNSHLRRIPGADLTVAGLVLPLAHAMPCSCTKTFPVGQASNTCVPPAEDEAVERLLVRVNLRPKRRTYDRCSWRYRDRWHHRVGDCCTRDPLLRSALDPLAGCRPREGGTGVVTHSNGVNHSEGDGSVLHCLLDLGVEVDREPLDLRDRRRCSWW
jgi:hypothetical protein